MTATKPVSRQHIYLVDSPSGPKARIVGHNIRVKDVVIWHEHKRMSVDEIVEQFPQLTRADFYAALACYWDNKDAFDASMSADDDRAEQLRRLAPPSRVREKPAQRQ